MENQPNIIMIVNDHQAYYRHGWDNGIKPRTPNFDRLADQGAFFERSYCSSPLCGPSRRTLLTGLYPHNHNNYYNYTNSPYDHDVYLDRLADCGYQNFYFGKWHAGPGTAQDFKAEGISFKDYGNPYTSSEYQQYLKKCSLPPAKHYVERVFDNPALSRQFPNLKENQFYQCDGYWCGEHAIGLTVTPKETHESFFLANLACQQLEKLADTAANHPFHLRVDFWGPHQPHFPTREFADLYDPKDIPVYGNFYDTLEGKPEYYAYDPNKPLSDNNNRLILPSPLSWADWQKILARVYAHITMVDAAGGLVLDKLDELGLTENTLVIWTADHGDGVASHGGHFDKGTYMTEEVIRVPLAIRYPRQIPSGERIEKLVSGVDIPPTILSAAGTEFSHPVDGKNILELFKRNHKPWRDDLLVETYGHGFGNRELGRLIIWNQYKYIDYQDHPKELYDLSNDPYELNNIANKPSHQEIVKHMQEKLELNLVKTGDKDFNKPVDESFIQFDEKQLDALFKRRGLTR